MTVQNTLIVFVFIVTLYQCAQRMNLAYKKATWQSQTSGHSTSDIVVDGVSTTCSTSNGSADNITWFVDLDAIHTVSEIEISLFPRDWNTARDGWMLAYLRLGFSVLVSNTTRMEDWILCSSFTQYTALTVPFYLALHAQCVVPTRFVIFYIHRHLPHLLTSRGEMKLCEVRVYGCPNHGFYGGNCDLPCPRHCRYCHPVSGVCFGGCNPGYSGHQCKCYHRKNLALHRNTYVTNRFSQLSNERTVVDGRKSDLSYGGGQCMCTKNQHSFVIWRVDLGYIRSIERVVIYSRNEYIPWGKSESASRLLGFSVHVSNTTDIRDGVVCFRETKNNMSTIPALYDLDCHAIGRYLFYFNVRIPSYRYPPGYSQYAFADICEIEVYGTPFPDYNEPGSYIPCMSMCRHRYLENLAFRKPTWQSTNHSVYTTSDKAVDGKTDDLGYSHCTMTEDQPHAIWSVNLTEMVTIDYIVLYFRTDNRKWPDRSSNLSSLPLGFSLYVSTSIVLSQSSAVLCYVETHHTADTIPEALNISCPYTGYYVIYTVHRSSQSPPGYSKYAIAALCEVEVYGCPVKVANYTECHLPCPPNCHECHKGTGICTKCKYGYGGQHCEDKKSPFGEIVLF